MHGRNAMFGLRVKMNTKRSLLTDSLQTLFEPDRRELVSMSLASTASAMRVNYVFIWLFDGRMLRFIGESGLEAMMPSEVDPGCGAIGTCFGQGRMIVLEQPFGEPLSGTTLLCDAEAAVTGYLVPLRLAGQIVGVLAALRTGERSIEPVDMAVAEVQCLKLMLALHHCTVSPEMCPDWMAVFEEQTGPSGGKHRLDSCPMLLANELPKGIHGPTLKSICKYLHSFGKQVTSKEVACALGLSQVTVGRYLTYMIDRRLVKRAVDHRQMGRPTYLYCVEQRCPQLRL